MIFRKENKASKFRGLGCYSPLIDLSVQFPDNIAVLITVGERQKNPVNISRMIL